jgi:hypothetical protein
LLPVLSLNPAALLASLFELPRNRESKYFETAEAEVVLGKKDQIILNVDTEKAFLRKTLSKRSISTANVEEKRKN